MVLRLLLLIIFSDTDDFYEHLCALQRAHIFKIAFLDISGKVIDDFSGRCRLILQIAERKIELLPADVSRNTALFF